MPPPVALAGAYLVTNLAIMVWMVREETRGRVLPPSAVVVARVLRYGPPLLGLVYLITVAGDWPFFLFVFGFFVLAFWMLDQLLNYPQPPRKR